MQKKLEYPPGLTCVYFFISNSIKQCRSRSSDIYEADQDPHCFHSACKNILKSEIVQIV